MNNYFKKTLSKEHYHLKNMQTWSWVYSTPNMCVRGHVGVRVGVYVPCVTLAA